MKKSYTLFANALLLLWFVLDMTGLNFGNSILVNQAWQDDGIFMLIFLGLLIMFIYREKAGKYLLSLWLFMWFTLQFFSHWSFTIADWGIGSNKIEYYANTIKIINSTTRYIPDLYHIIEHILLLTAMILTVIYCFQNRKAYK